MLQNEKAKLALTEAKQRIRSVHIAVFDAPPLRSLWLN
jgi:hypothetical protein